MPRVIVVDDDKDLVYTMSELLETAGMDVVGQGFDGKQAYELYSKLQPDYVLLDMKMPNYDGGYALERIKVDFPDAKIVVITGYTDYKFDKAEAFAVLSKPFEVDQLFSVMRVECIQ